MAPSLLTLLLALGSAVGTGVAAPATKAAAAGKPVGYRADGCTYAHGVANRTLTCKGHVKIWRDDLSLSCDSLVATFDATGQLRDARCHGAVHIITAEATADAAQAHFDATRQVVELTGRPKALQKGSVLRGQIIRMDLQTGEIALEGAVEGVLAPGVMGSLPGGSSAVSR